MLITFDLKAGGIITGISANFTIQLFGFSFDMYCVAAYRAHAMIKFRASVLPTLIYLNEIEWDGQSAVSNELLTSWSGEAAQSPGTEGFPLGTSHPLTGKSFHTGEQRKLRIEA